MELLSIHELVTLNSSTVQACILSPLFLAHHHPSDWHICVSIFLTLWTTRKTLKHSRPLKFTFVAFGLSYEVFNWAVVSHIHSIASFCLFVSVNLSFTLIRKLICILNELNPILTYPPIITICVHLSTLSLQSHELHINYIYYITYAHIELYFLRSHHPTKTILSTSSQVSSYRLTHYSQQLCNIP